MSDHNETLLETLAARERLLRHERIAAKQATTLMRAMDALQDSATIEGGIDRVLAIAVDAVAADAGTFLRGTDADRMATLAATAPDFGLPDWPTAATILRVRRRVIDLHEVPWGAALPAAARRYRALLSVPLAVDGEAPMAIVLLSERPAAFTRFDSSLMQRIARLIGQAMDRLSLVQRNAALACLVDPAGGAVALADGPLDAPSATLGRALGHIVEWQRQIVDITNDVLNAPTQAVEAAISTALARTGRLAGSDRTYVFRTRPPDRLDNTHEWVAPGIEPMIDRLQDMPDSILDEWRADMAAGHAIAIPDVSAMPADSPLRPVLEMQGIRSLLVIPMYRDRVIAGFVGYDAVRHHRRFLQAEIQLLQSVANAIGVVLGRADAERAAREAQASLLAERDRLQMTLAALPDLVLELDADGRFIGFNEGGGLAPAFPPEEFLGRTPEEALPHDLASMVRATMRALDAANRVEGFEYPMTIADEQRWFFVTAASKAARDRPGGYVLVVRDITLRRRQRREILRLGKIAEHTASLVMVTDAAGRIDWVNPAFEQRSGWTLPEIRGLQPDSFLRSPDGDPATARLIAQAVRDAKAVRSEVLNRSRAGEDYWVATDIQPLTDDSGQLEGLVWVATDITAIKRSHEAALEERAQAIEASGDGIAISTPSGLYTYMNSTHRAMFGIGPDEDVGKLTWQDLCPPDTVAAFLQHDWPHLKAKGFWRGQLRGLHRDGRIFPQDVSLTLKADGGLLCIARDISEQVRTAEQQAELREALQVAQRQETVAQIASGVAHDLNNLMLVVTGTLDVLETLDAGRAQPLAAIARIRRAMEAARDLVGNLGSTGRPDAPRAMQDLCALVSSAIELLGSTRKQAHGLTLALPDRPCTVWANPTELLQVVINLLLNACESGGETPAEVSVSVLSARRRLPARPPDVGSVQGERDVVAFSIRDTGSGIAPETRARLFERYFTTKGQAGTGLGLPIVATILRENGAALWVESDLGAGTTITVAWPSHAPAQVAVAAAAPATAGLSDLGGRNVLVVDDNPDVAAILADMLERAGAATTTVDDPVVARAVLRENPGLWSALVTDLHMARLDGVGLARVAASLQPSVPTVLVTALPGSVAAADPVFAASLPKPVSASHLIAAVRDAIAGHPLPAD